MVHPKNNQGSKSAQFWSYIFIGCGLEMTLNNPLSESDDEEYTPPSIPLY